MIKLQRMKWVFRFQPVVKSYAYSKSKERNKLESKIVGGTVAEKKGKQQQQQQQQQKRQHEGFNCVCFGLKIHFSFFLWRQYLDFRKSV